MNKQRYKRRSRISLTIKYSVDWHSDRVGVCTRLWNYVWIHRAGLLGYFERKLLSGGVHYIRIFLYYLLLDGYSLFILLIQFQLLLASPREVSLVVSYFRGWTQIIWRFLNDDTETSSNFYFKVHCRLVTMITHTIHEFITARKLSQEICTLFCCPVFCFAVTVPR